MAPTGFEGAHFPNKKRMKKMRKPSDEADLGLLYSDVEIFDSFLSGCSDWSTCSRFLAECDLREIANDNLALSSTAKAEKRRSGTNILFFDDLFPEIVNPEREGERQRSSISENSFSADSQKKKKKTAAGVGDDIFEVLGSSSTRFLSPNNDSTESTLPSGSTFEALTDCISRLLGEDDLIQNLEVTPVNAMKEIPVFSENVETPFADSELCKTDTHLLLTSPVSPKTYEEANTQTWSPTSALMREIDLHLELQNYLREFENYNASKTRTKNTLHSNNPRYRNSEEIEMRAEKLFEGKEKSTRTKRRVQQFSSKTNCHLDVEQPNILLYDELDEEHVESRLHCSQTQLKNILNKIRKGESERPSTAIKKHETNFTKEVIDGYEKIFSFDSHQKKRCNQNYWKDDADVLESDLKTAEGKTKKSSVSIKKKSLKSEKARIVFNLQDLILIYKNILEEHNKLQRRSIKPVKNTIFSYLNSLISKSVKKKQNEASLKKFSKKSFTSRHSLDSWKSLKVKDELVYLKEFVTAFQGILESSMPINEIMRMNNIISNLNSSPDGYKKYLSPKNSETGRTKSEKNKETPQKELSSELKIPSSAESSPERSVISSSSTSRTKRRRKSVSKEKKKVEPSPKDLQLKLESFLNAADDDYSGLSNLKGKMLVNVKVAKNQILVKDLSFLNNESSLPIKKTDTDGSSDLIIETVSTVQNKDNRVKRSITPDRKLSLTLSKMEEVTKKSAKSKKRIESPTEVKMKSENSTREPLKSPSRFEFDGMKLKTQHPIDSIAEDSNFGFTEKLKGKSEKKTGTSGTKLLKDISNDSDFSKSLLVPDDHLPEFNKNETCEKTIPKAKSFVIKPPLPDQCFNVCGNPPQSARSLIDLKTRSKRSKRSSSWAEKNFVCYSSITEEENAVASIKNSKQRKKVKISSPKANKMKNVENQNVFQEVSSDGLESDTNLETPIATPTSEEPELETSAVKLRNSVLYLSNEETDCCSIELLFSENNDSAGENPTATTEVKNQTKSFSEEQKMKTEVLNSADFVSSSSASVIFSPCHSATDDRSYSLALIHSDSFLKCFSQASLVQRDIKTFFKSSSDVKFHPENENEGKKDVKPFITFILTSEQFEKADLGDDVMIIKKSRFLSKEITEKAEEAEENNPQIRLQSIEDFIRDIAEAHANAKKMSTKAKAEGKKDFTPSLNKRKSKTRCQTCQFLNWREKKKVKRILRKMNRLGLEGKIKPGKTQNRTPRKNELAVKQVGNSKTVKIVYGEKIKHGAKEKTESKTTKTKKVGKIESEIKKKEKRSVMSMNLEDTPLELVEALKNAFSQAEDSKKNNTKRNVGESVRERKLKNKPKTPIKDVPKKSFVIKIYCDKISEKEINDRKEKSLPDESKKDETNRCESPALKKVEAKNLEKADSTYFDAVEKNLKDDIGGEDAGKEMNVKETKQSSANADAGASKKEKEKFAVKSTSEPSMTRSEEEFLQDRPEEILNEISKCIVEKQISFLLIMLDSFLNKTENLLSNKEKLDKTKNLIRSTNEETKKLMSCPEKSSWLKIFMVLDELSKFLATEDVNNFIKSHLKSTKSFVQKIIQFNIPKMENSLKMDSLKTGESQNIQDSIMQNLKLLKDKVDVKEIPFEEEPKKKIKTLVLPEKIQPFEEKTWEPLKTIIEEEEDLKTQKSNDSVLTEIQDMKDMVVDELKLLEKMFLISDWNQLLSNSEDAKNPSNDSGSSGSCREASDENNLNAKSRYLRFMQCLIKVWDTRMSLNIYPNDCFN